MLPLKLDTTFLKYHSNMYKVAISKPGFDVLAEIVPDNLLFSSEYNTLKYFLSGSLSININASANTFYNQTTYVEHGLGYLPFYLTYGNQPKNMTGYAPLGITYTFTDDGPFNSWYRHLKSWVTKDRLYVAVEGLRVVAGDTFTATFYYKIFRNKLNI